MALIKLTYGNENFSNPGKQCRVQVFYRPSLQGHDVPVVEALKKNIGGLKRGHFDTQDASTYNRHHGHWIEQQVEVEDGTVFVVRVTKTDSSVSAFGASTTFNVMLHCRRDAAMRRLSLQLTRHEKASRNEVYFEGRFDIITPEEFSKLNVYVNKVDSHLFDVDVWEDLYGEVEVLDNEITPLVADAVKKVTTATGKVILMKKSKQRIVKLN